MKEIFENKHCTHACKHKLLCVKCASNGTLKPFKNKMNKYFFCAINFGITINYLLRSLHSQSLQNSA